MVSKKAIITSTLIAGTTLSIIGNIYQGMAYTPNGKLLGSLGFMIAVHSLIDVSKFLSLASTLLFIQQKKVLQASLTTILFIAATLISLFSMNNAITANIKKEMRTDQMQINKLDRAIKNNNRLINEGNNNKFIQNCKWALSKRNKNYGTATKAFCNIKDSNGNIQKTSRPFLTQLNINLIEQKALLESKEYFSAATYLEENFNIASITSINVIIFLSTITIELVSSLGAYLFILPTVTATQQHKVKRKVTSKTKVKAKVKAKVKTKTKASTIVEPKSKPKSIAKSIAKTNAKTKVEAKTDNFASINPKWISAFNLYDLADKDEHSKKISQDMLAKALGTTQQRVSENFSVIRKLKENA